MIDAIERNRLYFDYRFYRQHTSVQNGEFIQAVDYLESAKTLCEKKRDFANLQVF